jgi:hypothetical protein
MNRVLILSAAITLIVLVGLVAIAIYPSLNSSNPKPFYVGVTFGGDTITDAKLLIDKVKNYTNLFVLQSGDFQRDANAMDEIGDYATSAGLNFLVYSGVDEAFQTDYWIEWIDNATQRWGSQFLGIYYGDEPGGKMLDTYLSLSPDDADIQLTKLGIGGLYVYCSSNGTDLVFWADGTVDYKVLDNSDDPNSRNGTLHIIYQYQDESVMIENVPKPTNESIGTFSNGTIVTWFWVPYEKSVTTTYYPNGTITVLKVQQPDSVLYTPENGSAIISQAEPYSKILERNPIKNCDEAAQAFINKTSNTFKWLENQSIPLFTSDYGLYWWDYLSGYDVTLAQLGWNNTVAQEIGLVRGAANLQGKSWGTIITWKYTEAPYLTSGDEMFEQMRTSYECGAEYVMLFNYAENMTGPYGILQDEHFQALERFWNEVVQNPDVVHGGVEAEAALVLPKNYGWGMRNPQDIIWGLWAANSTSQQIWEQLQSKLEQYGSKLDIVYDDSAYPVAGKYNQIYYWNQTD